MKRFVVVHQRHFFLRPHLKTTVRWLRNNILFLVLIFVENFFPLHFDVLSLFDIISAFCVVLHRYLTRFAHFLSGFNTFNIKKYMKLWKYSLFQFHFDVSLFDIISAFISFISTVKIIQENSCHSSTIFGNRMLF